MDKIAQTCNTVKRKLVPSSKLKFAVERKAEEIRAAVETQCGKASLDAEVRLDGSVAKETWIVGYVDADIFIRVSPELTKSQLRDICLPVAKRALKPNVTAERYAEHPYVESVVRFPGGNLRVNVVPCYNVQRGDWHSATDRTPYHTEYVRSHLTREQRDEVRLLKAFLRGLGTYGADIKTGGFSGMICETLVIAYGTFLNVLANFAEWSESRYVDVENYYGDRRDEIRRIFREPLVVIDPVDKGRNLGAAVRGEQLWNLVAGSRRFTKKPSVAYFFEPKVTPLKKAEFETQLRRRGSDIIVIAMGRIETVVDILWSQLFRTQRALVNLLRSNDFVVVRSAAWSDEHKLNLILLELESSSIPGTRKHYGPPVSRVSESSSFLGKHARSSTTLAGPWIEDDRWVVQKQRACDSARDLLTPILRDGGKNAGVAPLIVRAFKRSARLYEGRELGKLVVSNAEFGKFMRSYLKGRPTWLG